ncbi:hypothetical protein M406DRAFT_326806 [Cryphonectria parasitica EP155]|uniref:Uncharacterized protein n=1 Tax=Cryphonectria parasitica (strain ATCC 38755 / EP155) TaxID=660469 RepID=A0A9P4Y844_CRYP1|nr:uncharacterized protein M406DRAFT_326806 [Cryphonectria parasitica EP155]KAF3768205.1 hypothetical protein M406DRAFT_326806 [Cryphonectria parasitica EP155]
MSDPQQHPPPITGSTPSSPAKDQQMSSIATPPAPGPAAANMAPHQEMDDQRRVPAETETAASSTQQLLPGKMKTPSASPFALLPDETKTLSMSRFDLLPDERKTPSISSFNLLPDQMTTPSAASGFSLQPDERKTPSASRFAPQLAARKPHARDNETTRQAADADDKESARPPQPDTASKTIEEAAETLAALVERPESTIADDSSTLAGSDAEREDDEAAYCTPTGIMSLDGQLEHPSAGDSQSLAGSKRAAPSPPASDSPVQAKKNKTAPPHAEPSTIASTGKITDIPHCESVPDGMVEDVRGFWSVKATMTDTAFHAERKKLLDRILIAAPISSSKAMKEMREQLIRWAVSNRETVVRIMDLADRVVRKITSQAIEEPAGREGSVEGASPAPPGIRRSARVKADRERTTATAPEGSQARQDRGGSRDPLLD